MTVREWRGHKVLQLSGPIDKGTRDKLESLIDTVPPMPYGLPILLLNSPGGSVDEAMKISALLDRKPVHAVVPDGAKCASACGSIIFIAGKARTIEENGALGQHSCSSGGIPDEACNEELSMHAVKHGVSHGSIAAFVTYTPPEKVMWFSREDAEGWGLTKYPGEEQSSFEKSEPRVIKLFTGRMPPAQSAWRINFRDDGFQAFVRTASDFEREMQLNVFCYEKIQGHLYIGMEVNGPAFTIQRELVGVSIITDKTSWKNLHPIVWQRDNGVSEIVVEIPSGHIKEFLTKSNKLTFGVALRKPYQPMVAQTWLSASRKVLLFAANNCVKN